MLRGTSVFLPLFSPTEVDGLASERRLTPETMSDTTKQLGQRIRELRRALTYTQEELAELGGISVSFLSMIERAERVPHVETLVGLAKALGVNLSQIFDGINQPGHGSKQTLLPLIAYLESLHLDSSDVEALLVIARAMFRKKA